MLTYSLEQVRVYRYYIPRYLSAVSPNAHYTTIALEPRAFQTMCDADGRAIEWGTGEDTKTILFLCRCADKIQGRVAQKKKRQSYLETSIFTRTSQDQEQDHRGLP